MPSITIRKNTSSKRPAAAPERNEHGFTLIEILVAVTILSIVSLAFMGYFVTAMERSADNNHRTIAANLARLKAEELKEAFRQPLPTGGRYETYYAQLVEEMPPGAYALIMSADANAGQGVAGMFKGMLDPHLPIDEAGGSVHSTLYRYQVEISNRSDERLQQLNAANQFLFPLRMEESLLRMVVTVFWQTAEDGSPVATKSVSLDTYLIGR